MAVKKDLEPKSFGKIIGDARKAKNLQLSECAALILKKNKIPISLQYLSDLEKGRRNPPSAHMLIQFSKILEIPVELLYFYAEKYPEDLNKNISPERIVAAYRTFIESLR